MFSPGSDSDREAFATVLVAAIRPTGSVVAPDIWVSAEVRDLDSVTETSEVRSGGPRQGFWWTQ